MEEQLPYKLYRRTAFSKRKCVSASWDTSSTPRTSMGSIMTVSTFSVQLGYKLPLNDVLCGIHHEGHNCLRDVIRNIFPVNGGAQKHSALFKSTFSKHVHAAKERSPLTFSLANFTNM